MAISTSQICWRSDIRDSVLEDFAMTAVMDKVKSDAPFDWSVTDADYMSPVYLRTHFRQVFAKSDRGIYWLRAPAGMGKTQFVRGVFGKRPGKDPTKPEGIDSSVAVHTRAIGVHIRKEDGIGCRRLVEGLQAAFDADSVPNAQERAQTFASLSYEDPVAAREGFVAWLIRLRDCAAAKGDLRLIVCIDGLDQMAEPEAVGEGYPLLELLPSTTELPANVTLLLCSRPAADWPQGLFERAQSRIGDGAGLTTLDLTLREKAHVQLMQRYFAERLRAFFRSRALAHLQGLLETNTPFEKGGRDARLTNDPTLRDGLKGDWKKLTNKFPRWSLEQLPVNAILGVLDERDKLWAEMADRTELRFGHFATLTARLLDGSITVEEVGGLPKGDAMLASLARASPRKRSNPAE
jgi:hypothetical protein